jgi:hypothetical protein
MSRLYFGWNSSRSAIDILLPHRLTTRHGEHQ